MPTGFSDVLQKNLQMKNILNLRLGIFAMLAAMFAFTSCVDNEFDTPPTSAAPTGTVLTIQQIRDSLDNTSNETIIFDQDYVVYGVISMDDKSGNIYKTAYMQDGEAGIALHFNSSGGVYQGDSIMVYLKGLKVSKYAELPQIDAVDGDGLEIDSVIYKKQTLVHVEPKVVTIHQLANNQCQLVKLEGVEFSSSDTSQTWSDAINLETKNLTLKACDGSEIIVRTSGYANFAGEPVPNGNGTLIAIVGQFNSDMQLYIRSADEVVMEGTRCDGSSSTLETILNEGFTSDFGSFTAFSITGSNAWEYADYDNGCMKMASFGGNEDWLVSSAIDLTNHNSSLLALREAINHIDDIANLQIVVSTDYDGTSSPETFTWNALTLPTRPAGDSWTFFDSGSVDISAYDGQTIYIAFKYTTSTSSAGSTWEVGEIIIQAEHN